jgi:hypothetical protein
LFLIEIKKENIQAQKSLELAEKMSNLILMRHKFIEIIN